jgi:hypothetical protein
MKNLGLDLVKSLNEIHIELQTLHYVEHAM